MNCRQGNGYLRPLQNGETAGRLLVTEGGLREMPQAQTGLLDGLSAQLPGNEFLERLERRVDWAPLRQEVDGLFAATTSWLPRPPLVLGKMLFLRRCCGLSNPRCGLLVGDRLSWRRFVGPSLEVPVLDETALARFPGTAGGGRPAGTAAGRVNAQLETPGLILKRVTLVYATLLQAASGRSAGRRPRGRSLGQGRPAAL